MCLLCCRLFVSVNLIDGVQLLFKALSELDLVKLELFDCCLMCDDFLVLCLLIFDHDLFILGLHACDFLFLQGNFLLQTSNLFDFLLLFLTGFQCLTHAKGHRTIIQSLIVRQEHPVLISDPHEKETSFSAVNRDLPYHLVKDL